MQTSGRHDGFSLVELSIVLVILGLLVGGVLSGRSLIRAAELRNITVEYQQWQTAVNTFRQKYNALPGDFAKARDFWGNAADCAWSVDTPISTGKATCNGDGAGTLLPSLSPGGAVTSMERLTFWQHLSNAGLVEGSYNGMYNMSGGLTIVGLPGISLPATKSGSGGWLAQYEAADPTAYFNGFSGANVFILLNPMAADLVGAAVLTPEEQWGIDTKIDDGKPATGVLFTSHGGSLPDCTARAGGAAGATGATHVDAVYKLSHTGKSCIPFFAF